MSRVILHHAALPHRGGAVRVARLLIHEQSAARAGTPGYDARLSFEVAENDPEALDGGDASSTPIPLLGPTPPGDLGRALASLPADALLHLHTSTDWPALLEGLLGHAQNRRVLLTLHDATPLTGGCAYPLDCPHFPVCADPCPRGFPAARAHQAETADLLRRLTPHLARPVLVSPSGWLAGLARQTLGNIPDLPVRVIPNGVPWPDAANAANATNATNATNADRFPTRAQARAALGLAPTARVALFAAHGGARAAYKSGPRWPEYWQGLRQGLPQALAFAVGGDETSCRDGLTVWPYVDRQRLTLLMRAADVLAYPTLADNHPLVLLEAAALELPVVSFAVGGVPEIVIHGETGLLVPPSGGIDAFCLAARSLLADPARARRLGLAARSRGAKRFTAARMAADYAVLLG